MKLQLRHWILILVLFGILAIITPSFLDFLKYNVSNKYNKEFKTDLFLTINQSQSFTMNNLTDFEWDQAHIFGPYLSREYMESIVGRKWTNANTYLGYLYQSSSLDEFPLSHEEYYKLVFVSKGKVVLDITLERSKVEFLDISKLIHKDNTRLMVQKEANNKYTIRPSK